MIGILFVLYLHFLEKKKWEINLTVQIMHLDCCLSKLINLTFSLSDSSLDYDAIQINEKNLSKI